MAVDDQKLAASDKLVKALTAEKKLAAARAARSAGPLVVGVPAVAGKKEAFDLGLPWVRWVLVLAGCGGLCLFLLCARCSLWCIVKALGANGDGRKFRKPAKM